MNRRRSRNEYPVSLEPTNTASELTPLLTTQEISPIEMPLNRTVRTQIKTTQRSDLVEQSTLKGSLITTQTASPLPPQTAEPKVKKRPYILFGMACPGMKPLNASQRLKLLKKLHAASAILNPEFKKNKKTKKQK